MKPLLASIALAGAALAATPASAALTWNWSFTDGSAAGTFQTDGTAADLVLGHFFAIDSSSFAVTQATFSPSPVGTAFSTLQTSQGFTWAGTSPSSFTAIGLFGPVPNVQFTSSRYVFRFAASPLPIAFGNADDIFLEASRASSTVTLTPVVSAVPEPGTWALLVAGLGVLAVARPRRRAHGTPNPSSRLTA